MLWQAGVAGRLQAGPPGVGGAAGEGSPIRTAEKRRTCAQSEQVTVTTGTAPPCSAFREHRPGLKRPPPHDGQPLVTCCFSQLRTCCCWAWSSDIARTPWRDAPRRAPAGSTVRDTPAGPAGVATPGVPLAPL